MILLLEGRGWGRIERVKDREGGKDGMFVELFEALVLRMWMRDRFFPLWFSNIKCAGSESMGLLPLTSVSAMGGSGCG